MDERMTHLWAGAEAEAIGYRGLAVVARVAGLAIRTVTLGRDEIRAGVKKKGLLKVRHKGDGAPLHSVRFADGSIGYAGNGRRTFARSGARDSLIHAYGAAALEREIEVEVPPF
jgi:hypothetical protein